MDTIGDLAIVAVPAVIGLLGWVFLRQRNTPPLLAGCLALLIALAVMAAIFTGAYLL